MTLPTVHKLGVCRYSGLELRPTDVLKDDCCCFDYEQTVIAMRIRAEVYDEAQRELRRRIKVAIT